MYQIPRDYLMTYDTACVELHEDSSDFDETCVPTIAPKKGNHNLIKRDQPRNKPKQSQLFHTNLSELYGDCDMYPMKLKHIDENPPNIKSNHNNKKTGNTSKNGKTNYLNSGDRLEPVKSKISIMKHKLIPCLSSIFKRSNNDSTKHNMSVIEENRAENKRTDNCCQRCSNCEQRRMRKLYKRQNYAVQPVYAIEGNAHKTPALFGSTKITEPLHNDNRKKSKNQYSSCCSLSTSSESVSVQERQLKVKQFRKRLKTEIMKEHVKYQQKLPFRNQHLRYPLKDQKSSYQVFTTPYQSRTNLLRDSDSRSGLNEIPPSSSSFWDFLYEKISRKYQTQRLEMPKPCQCNSSSQLESAPGNCQNMLDPKPEPMVNSTGCRGRNHSTPGTTCCCKTGPGPVEQITTGTSYQNVGTSSNGTSVSVKTSSKSLKKQTQEKKVQCKCYGKKKPSNDSSQKFQKFPPPAPDSKPCQESHDVITSALADKYKGEILCIHNPPCILINGCLNLPPQKEQAPMAFWPVTAINKGSFFNRNKKEKVQQEQSCQYNMPYVEHRRCQPEYKTEKKIQSICHHDPPCEVVRGCYKAKYDPQLQSSCVHVPMCKRVPECMVGKRSEGTACEHKPRCPDIPTCSRNYVLLTARENIGTQVKPKDSFVCRHVPPCILIPKCLGKAMCDAYVPVDAIPGCLHQPSCDLIPACCRRSAKEMVSVSSQYPNSCRIV